MQSFLLNHKVKWKFNLERAPWWGGFFERMVRCVKRCLKKILKNAKLTYEELLTVVVEIECVLNSRPLTYVSSEDRVEPLTPSHLLTGRRLLSIPDESIVAEEESSEVEILTWRQRYVTSLLSHFGGGGGVDGNESTWLNCENTTEYYRKELSATHHQLR